MSLVEFLTARLDEEESWARSTLNARADEQRTGWVAVAVVAQPPVASADWLLRDAAAKRAIMDRCLRILAAWSEDGHDHVDATDTLMHLATVYADHEDYRQEWKP